MSLSSTSSASTTVLLPGRATATAHRLLSGAGSASLVAYRHDAGRSVPVLAHGLSAAGDLVVAVVADELGCGTDQPTEVRVDVRREAGDARVRVIAASAHLLGRVEWVTDGAHAEDLADQALDADGWGAAASLAGMPGVRVGVVAADRVLLHDATGVTAYPIEELTGEVDPAFPAKVDEIDAHEAVARLSATELGALCTAVTEGRIAGALLSERPAPLDPAVLGEVFCVQVDGVGVDLMRVEADRTTVVFVAFPEQVGDVRGVRRQLATLRAHAAA